jgi:hypothetical protein
MPSIKTISNAQVPETFGEKRKAIEKIVRL